MTLLVISLLLDVACTYVCTEFVIRCIRKKFIIGYCVDIKDNIMLFTCVIIMLFVFYSIYRDIVKLINFIGGN